MAQSFLLMAGCIFESDDQTVLGTNHLGCQAFINEVDYQLVASVSTLVLAPLVVGRRERPAIGLSSSCAAVMPEAIR